MNILIQHPSYLQELAENGHRHPNATARMIEWAERINEQWSEQEQDTLTEQAQQWINHLQQNDEERLYQSIRRAFDLMMQAGRGANLRPHFYRGLFAYATAEEQQHFQIRVPSNAVKMAA